MCHHGCHQKIGLACADLVYYKTKNILFLLCTPMVLIYNSELGIIISSEFVPCRRNSGSTMYSLVSISTIIPRRQIRCLLHNLSACCRLCYTSAFQRMKFIFRYVIVHALRSILVPQYMGVVMINSSFSDDLVIHDINRKTPKNHGSAVGQPWGQCHCIGPIEVHTPIRAHS